jgi:hypothetical protein
MSWVDLEVDPTYGLVEGEDQGRINLGATSHDFEAASSGESLERTFANSQLVTVEGCTLEQADGEAAITDDQTPLQL